MSLPLIVRPPAQNDIRQAYDFLNDASQGLGDRFRQQLELAFRRIESNPKMCGCVLEDVRAVRVKKFRYIVYYVEFSDRIEVLAVIHGSRHESAWQSRV
jgi:toxin ParE1/3/4